MHIDLTITYDDLSEQCKKKIDILEKMVGKNNVTVLYTDISRNHIQIDCPPTDFPKAEDILSGSKLNEYNFDTQQIKSAPTTDIHTI